MNGGAIFDLAQDFEIVDNVEENLEKLEREYGNNFKIKFIDIILDVVLKKAISDINGVSSYVLYHEEEDRTNNLRPFLINFIDFITLEKGKNSYIWNIHRTKDVNGTNMVKFVLEINRKLGVQKTYLQDGAHVNCDEIEYDLSFFKLLEKKTTFYTSLGFEFEVNKIFSIGPMFRFNTERELTTKLNELIDQIKSIKIVDLIKEYQDTLDLITHIVKDNNQKNMKIMLRRYNVPMHFNNVYQKENPYGSINSLFNECIEMLNFLNKTQEKYLYKYLIEIFKDTQKCRQYNSFTRYIVENQRYKIIYGEKEITREYIILFQILNTIKNSYMYVYDFTKSR
jgi:F0F1-type ATP synthase delta subunit